MHAQPGVRVRACACVRVRVRACACVRPCMSTGREISSFISTLDTVVFGQNTDARLTAVFQQIKEAPYLLQV